jgi:hypothetical protein
LHDIHLPGDIRMSDETVITISDIRMLANRLCDILESKGQTAVRVTNRHYWTIFVDDAFNAQEPHPALGDVVDDFADARQELSATKEFPVIWHAADHLAGLIQLIGYADLKSTLTTAHK